MSKRNANRFAWSENLEAMSVTVKDKVTEVEMEFDTKSYSEVNRDRLILFGIKQLCQTRTSQTPGGEKMDGYARVDALMQTDTWALDAKRGGGSTAHPMIEIIMRVKGVEFGEAQKGWNAASKKTKDRLLEDYKEEIHQIREARSAAEALPLDDM